MFSTKPLKLINDKLKRKLKTKQKKTWDKKQKLHERKIKSGFQPAKLIYSKGYRAWYSSPPSKTYFYCQFGNIWSINKKRQSKSIEYAKKEEKTYLISYSCAVCITIRFQMSTPFPSVFTLSIIWWRWQRWGSWGWCGAGTKQHKNKKLEH